MQTPSWGRAGTIVVLKVGRTPGASARWRRRVALVSGLGWLEFWWFSTWSSSSWKSIKSRIRPYEQQMEWLVGKSWAVWADVEDTHATPSEFCCRASLPAVWTSTQHQHQLEIQTMSSEKLQKEPERQQANRNRSTAGRGLTFSAAAFSDGLLIWNQTFHVLWKVIGQLFTFAVSKRQTQGWGLILMLPQRSSCIRRDEDCYLFTLWSLYVMKCACSHGPRLELL